MPLFNVSITIVCDDHALHHPRGYVFNHGFATFVEVREFLANYSRVALPGEQLTITTI